MSRNTLYAVIAVLAVAALVLGWMYWNQTRTHSVSLQVDQGGVSIESN